MTPWTDSYLDEMRRTGDAPADEAISALGSNDAMAAADFAMALVKNPGLPANLPGPIGDYLDRTAAVPAGDPVKLRLAGELFTLYGPEIMLILGFYSLPADYAAKKGVRVLYQAGVMRQRAMARLFETMQMVIDVMQPGGMVAGSDGVTAVRKARLIHALTRYRLAHGSPQPQVPSRPLPPTQVPPMSRAAAPSWPAPAAVPGVSAVPTPRAESSPGEAGGEVRLNQEDMAGTLLSFSLLGLDGLASLGVVLSDEQKAAYLHAWSIVGQLMGLRGDLITHDMDQARALMHAIARRQYAPCQEGRELTAMLIQGMQGLLPSQLLNGLPASTMRFFLEKGLLAPYGLADLLAIPPENWTAALTHDTARLADFVCSVSHGSTVAEKTIRWLSFHMIETLVRVETRNDNVPFPLKGRRPFRAPPGLLSEWERRLPPAQRAAG